MMQWTVLLLLGLSGCGPAGDEPARPAERSEAARLVEAQRFGEALALYQRDIAAEPTAERYSELGRLYARMGHLAKAKEAFVQARTLDPDHLQASHNLSVVLADEGALPEAIEILTPFAQQASAAPEILHTLALFSAKQGLYAQAEALLKRGLAAEPEEADLHRELGQLYTKQGRLEQAETHLAKADGLKPDHAETQRLLGLLRTAQQQNPEALQLFQRVLELDPHHIEAHYNLSQALYATGRPEAAEAAMARFENLSGHAAQIARLRRGLDAAPEDVELRLQLAHHYRQLGRPQQALDHYRAALLDAPDRAELHLQLAGLYQQLGQGDEALALCRNFLAAYPAHPRRAQVHFLAGYLELRAKRLPQAQQAFEAAVAADSSYAEAWNNLGNLHLMKNDSTAAIDAFRQAVAAKADFADAHFNLATLYARRGSAEAAIAHYQQALTSDPAYVKAHFALGALWQGQDRKPEAITAFKAFLAAWDGDPQMRDEARQRLAQLDARP